MKIAIVTPYYREDLSELRACHESVLAQELPCTHVLVADGHPQGVIDGWDCEHVVLPTAHADKGDFARGMGALHAINTGAEFVAFLDADNWIEPDHALSLVNAALHHQTAITTCRRSLRRLDGSVLDAFDAESDGEHFADTSTILYHKSVLDVLSLWATMPAALGGIGDQIVWAAIKARGYPSASTGRATLNYRTSLACHYHARHEAPPPGAADLAHVKASHAAWHAMSAHQQRRILRG